MYKSTHVQQKEWEYASLILNVTAEPHMVADILVVVDAHDAIDEAHLPRPVGTVLGT